VSSEFIVPSDLSLFPKRSRFLCLAMSITLLVLTLLGRAGAANENCHMFEWSSASCGDGAFCKYTTGDSKARSGVCVSCANYNCGPLTDFSKLECQTCQTGKMTCRPEGYSSRPNRMGCGIIGWKGHGVDWTGKVTGYPGALNCFSLGGQAKDAGVRCGWSILSIAGVPCDASGYRPAQGKHPPGRPRRKRSWRSSLTWKSTPKLRKRRSLLCSTCQHSRL